MQFVIGGLGRALRWSADLLANKRELQSSLTQSLCRARALLAQKSEQKMLGADVPVSHALGFFRAIRQHAFAFVAQRKIDRSTGCRRGFMGPDLRFERRYSLFRPKQTQRKGMILMEQPEE